MVVSNNDVSQPNDGDTRTTDKEDLQNENKNLKVKIGKLEAENEDLKARIAEVRSNCLHSHNAATGVTRGSWEISPAQ